MQMLFLYVKVVRYSYFMIWKSDLSVFARFIYLMVFVVIFDASIVRAASVPITVEEDYGGLPEPQNTMLAPIRAILAPIIDEERNTCDPDFWGVMKDRAWQEGQREITQNNNLIARPDSVLQMTCFDSFINHLTNYADSHFPGDPQESVGEMGGILGSALSRLSGRITDLVVISPDKVFYSAGSLLNVPGGMVPGGGGTDGFLMYAVLEMLVLDQLVDGVTNDLMTGYDIVEMLLNSDTVKKVALAACGLTSGSINHKEYYTDDNFPDSMLGNRASIPVNIGAGSMGTISSNLSDRASTSSYACNRMNQVWQASKCYNMLAESNMFGVTPDHDGFYPLSSLDSTSTLPNYTNEAASGRDFRTREAMCDVPSDNFDISDYLPNATEFACGVAFHGLPNVSGCSTSNPVACLPALQTVLTGLFGSGPRPDWASTLTGANPPAGAAGGVDPYEHFLGLRDSTSCSSIAPIKTGYIVNAPDGTRYVDAVCPAPGCYFNPPATITDSGRCN